MQQVRYAMHFQGEAESVSETVLKAATKAPSTRIESKAGSDGVSSSFSPIDGGEATFTSEVRLTGGTSLDEDGTIDFGGGNSVQFSTVGEGHVAPSPEDGLMHGCVMWKIDSGTGRFEGASGLITSNFTLSGDMKVNDYQFGVIWVR